MAHKTEKVQPNPHLGLLNRPWADPNPAYSLALPVLTGQFRLVIEAARLLFTYQERSTAWHFSHGIGNGELGQWWHPDHQWLTVMAGRPGAAAKGSADYAGRLGDLWLKVGAAQLSGVLAPRHEDRLAAYCLPKAPSAAHQAEYCTTLQLAPVCWADHSGQRYLPGIHRPPALLEPDEYHRRMTFLEEWFPWVSEPHGSAPPAARRKHQLLASRRCEP